MQSKFKTHYLVLTKTLDYVASTFSQARGGRGTGRSIAISRLTPAHQLSEPRGSAGYAAKQITTTDILNRIAVASDPFKGRTGRFWILVGNLCTRGCCWRPYTLPGSFKKKIISLSMCTTFFSMNLKSSSFGIGLIVVLGCHEHHTVGF